jgi:hypothetical protein
MRTYEPCEGPSCRSTGTGAAASLREDGIYRLNPGRTDRGEAPGSLLAHPA